MRSPIRISAPALDSAADPRDEQLMLDAQAGTAGSFDALFERYRAPIWRFFRRRVADEGRAEELAQDVFTALLDALPRYRTAGPFRSYLFAIAYNVLQADRRKAGTRMAQPLDDEMQAADTAEPESALWVRCALAQLDATIDALKRLGQVTRESRNAEDVTQQSTDLDARLANARLSEKRLKDILESRTGDLSDVLSVEREIGRIRGDIERMEGERKALDGRITYATLALDLSEEEKSAMDLGPMPVSTRLRNAFIEGWRSAFSSGLDAAVVAVRVAPTLLLWGLVLALPAWYIRRRFAR